MSLPTCVTCGAPREAGVLVCRYCRAPYVANAARNGIPCPACGLLHERAAQKCAACATWLIVQCVFCGTLSPHHDTNCLKCREPFAGSAERLAQRRQEAESKRQMEMVSSAGNVAVGLIGAIARTGIVEQVVRSSDHGHHDSGDDGGGGFFDSLFGGDDVD